ncbi:RNA polymerase sigma factor [Pseudobacter ginsenosidimutans]|uniref:RNA polymerase sigma-70 factor (ECF subfamily) n=1 Tax=Pseudobacter ginsenosidimutans TaxID=661488 RepID=A0A4Q7N511_9BACT|nr:sigma-70 family RNA polymerase sigma factor [Pseudobacter ginsenosidimutans]RZS76133.1 RNA polymerase sigma-70 factor (ECF subfamily) [Pseudobacter ginsenosidimutans]
MPIRQPYDEKELLTLIAEEDEKAFETIFLQYGDLIHAHTLTITKSHIVAKDLVQDVFLRVWLYRDKLPEIRDFRTWLLRIAYNRCFHFLRQQKVQQSGLDTYAAKYGITGETDNSADSPNMLSLQSLVQQAIADMTPQQQKIYRLSREEGLKIPEIAERLGLSASTVKNTLVRALQALRNSIEKSHYSSWMLLIWKTAEIFFDPDRS